MLTEKDAIQAVPPQGFVTEFVTHAVKQTTSPLAYHLGTALTILGCTCPLDYGMNYAGRLRANMFTLLVGRSGADMKSSALGIGRDVLFEAAAPLIGDYPGSPEGLIDSLARSPSQVIPISEFGRFLAAAQRGYYEPIKALLADLWDCHSIQRSKANGKGVRVDNPRLSVLAACSIPYLEKYTLSEDWSGGFMGRWAVMFGRSERIDPDPVGDMSNFDSLATFLRERALVPNGGWCEGLTPNAKKLWRDWYFDMTDRKIPEQIVGVKSRAPTMARKAALLYAWDWGIPLSGEPWQMDEDELDYGIRFAELHIKSILGLSEVIADHPDARMRRKVIEAVSSCGGVATLGQILQRLKMRRKPVSESLDALVEEGKLRRLNVGTGYVYEMQGYAG